MNVCLISREYPPFFGGGIGAYTVRWSRALAAHGHRVVVVTVSDDGRETRDRDGDVTVIRLPFIRGSGQTGDWSGPHPAIADGPTLGAFHAFSPVAVFSMQVAQALPRLVREFEVEIIEVPDTGALGWFPLLRRRCGADGPPMVTCVHSPTEWISRWNVAPLTGRRDAELVWMERDSAAWSDGLVAPSGAMAAWVADHWGVGTPAVIPYPLGDLEQIARASARRTEGPRLGRSIVFAGRLEPRKGVRVLLEGFALAASKGADLSLDLVGEDMPESGGMHGQRLLERLPPAIRACVRAHGRLETAAIDALRAPALAVAVPSPMDNFPNTCMEAMALGKVVLAAGAGGMADMIRDGVDGLLFRPEDVESCAETLLRIAEMPHDRAAALGSAAAARMLDLCGNGSIVHRRVAHYESLRPGSRAASDVRYAIVGHGERAVLERLRSAASAAGADFAHGWSGGRDGLVHVFSTPRRETLDLAPGDLGPVAVRANLAGSLPRGTTPREAVLRLLDRGARGIVVPDAISFGSGDKGPFQRLFRAATSAWRR
jgi:glycosyltransferase involved in cell wall biosynthesis